jgi:RNA 3'-phosphate cyclase
MTDTILIDGSYGEGGGQIIRTAISLSALTGKPTRIENIRANRPNPGLNFQHKTSVEAVARLCNAKIKGLDIGSKTIEFIPSSLKGGNIKLNIGTAGSIPLVFQSCLPLSLFTEGGASITIMGGTDVKWSPPIDFIKYIFLTHLKRMGLNIDLEIITRGYYPKGGGEVLFNIRPCLEILPFAPRIRGNLRHVKGLINLGNLPDHISHRMKQSVNKNLIEIRDIKILTNKTNSISPGIGLVLWAEFDNTVVGANVLGERGIPAEKLGKNAANTLMQDIDSKALVDVYSADQLLIYMALAKGYSSFTVRELSNHARTHIWLIEKLLEVKFNIEDFEGLKRVSIDGISFSPNI